jgi:HlyD family secretion protein
MNKFITLCLLLSLLGCYQPKADDISGYVEGDFIYLAAPFAGILQELVVQRGESVTAGSLLFKLDPEPELSQLHQAKQQLVEASASLKLVELRLTRAQQLLRHDAAAQDALDEAQAAYSKQLAYVKQAQANLNQMRWSMRQKVLLAPSNAQVFATYFQPGEWVASGQPVLSLLRPRDIHVVFFIPELLLSQLKLGSRLQISCDSCQRPVKATIAYIAPKAEYTPPVLYNRSNNHRLVYKVEAKFQQDSHALRPGQPVYIKMLS